MDRDTVRGVVVAGGASTRFGDGSKALATLDGDPLVARVVDAVAAATAGPPVLAVADATQADRLRAAVDGPVATVTDAPGHEGPLAGLFAAAAAVDRAWLFACACDMPLVTADGVAAVRDRATADADAVVPVVDGHRQPLYACYRTAALRRVREDVPAAAGPRALGDCLDGVVRPDAAALDADLARAVTNVNTRADLRALRDGG